MTKDTVGREPVQIVELVQPFCANTYGVFPCTAALGADAKCYNTRATCQDTQNYRIQPEAGMTLDGTFADGDTIVSGDIDRSNDWTMAVDVTFGAAPDGIIYEQGGSGTGSALYVASSVLVWRVGDGGAGQPTDCAKVTASITPYIGKKGTLYATVDVSADTAALYFFDPATRILTLIGSNVSAITLASPWTGTSAGAVGEINGTIAGSETTTPFNGVIDALRIFNNELPPSMPDHFNLRLFFARGHVSDMDVVAENYIIPSLESVSTAPSKINMNTANPDARGLGNRAICTIRLQDHLHTDRLVDPYIDGRSWDALDGTRGTFWARWVVRNKYRSGMRIIIYEGYDGEALSAMRTREYFLDEVTGPSSGGGVTIKGKDALARVEARKAKCPVLSPGLLYQDIDASVNEILVANALISDYPASGILRIDDEIVTYSAISAVGTYLQVTGVLRARYNTVADEHKVDASVQECVLFESQTVNTALETLLIDYGGLERNWLDTLNWADEVDDSLGFYLVDALITEPTSVEDLVGELQTQCLFYVWWCECNSIVRMSAISGLRGSVLTLTDASHILEDSYSRTEYSRQRLSRVWIHYDQDDFVEDADKYKAYHSSYALADPVAESGELYDSPSTKTIFSRWLNSDVLVRNTARKILVRQIDPPEAIKFQLDAKDRDTWTGDKVYISHPNDVDEFGARRERLWTIISAEEKIPGEMIEYVAENSTAYGVASFVMAPGPDYVDPASSPSLNCYIGDANGLLSDGTPSGVIT